MCGAWCLARAAADDCRRNDMEAEQETAMEHYDMTVAMLNKSMGLCLR